MVLSSLAFQILFGLIWLVLLAFFSITILSILWILAERIDGKLSWFFKDNKGGSELVDWPKVSLLLAARNEEELIIRCLEHIDALDYPADKLEILIGDDQSSDRTAELVKGFIQDKPQFKLFSINETMGKGRGKANVLAHLAHEADGEFYFITDVDVALPSTWIKAMLEQFDESTGIASGTTMCNRGGLFATMQSIDWLHFMGYIKAFAKVNIGCTSVGNNMAVRSKAYWETGGYENIDFSITEDYKLFKEVTERGWKWSNTLDSRSLGLATHISSIKEMLHQRKRWLIGARELPLNWKLMILLYGLFIPALIILFLIDPYTAAITWFLKFTAQSIFVSVLCIRLKIKAFSLLQLMIYELYVLLNTAATAVFYLLPFKSVWKGRIYNKSYIGS